MSNLVTTGIREFGANRLGSYYFDFETDVLTASNLRVGSYLGEMPDNYLTNISVLSGGIATNTTVIGIGRIDVYNGGLTVGTNLGNSDATGSLQQTEEIASGGTSQQATVGPDGVQTIDAGGISKNALLTGGGNYSRQFVSGTAIATTLIGQSEQDVQAGGIAQGTIINSSSFSLIQAGGFSVGAVVKGGVLAVSGNADTTTVTGTGIVSVENGGVLTKTVVANGGRISISSVGSVSGITINNGGILYFLEPNSNISNVSLNPGGSIFFTIVGINRFPAVNYDKTSGILTVYDSYHVSLSGDYSQYNFAKYTSESGTKVSLSTAVPSSSSPPTSTPTPTPTPTPFVISITPSSDTIGNSIDPVGQNGMTLPAGTSTTDVGGMQVPTVVASYDIPTMSGLSDQAKQDFLDWIFDKYTEIESPDKDELPTLWKWVPGLISLVNSAASGVAVGNDINAIATDLSNGTDTTNDAHKFAVDIGRLAGTILATVVPNIPGLPGAVQPSTLLPDLLGAAADGWWHLGITLTQPVSNFGLSVYDQIQTYNAFRSVGAPTPTTSSAIVVRKAVFSAAVAPSSPFDLVQGLPSLQSSVLQGATVADYSGIQGSLQAVLLADNFLQTNVVNSPVVFGASDVVGSSYDDLFDVEIGSGNWTIDGNGGQNELVVGVTHDAASLTKSPGSFVLTLSGASVTAQSIQKIRFEDGVVDPSTGQFTPISSTTVGSASPPVFRFFDSKYGTHLFTQSMAEAQQILATRPDLTKETNNFSAVSQSNPSAEPVYRFFETGNGTHFFTASQAEFATLTTPGLPGYRTDLTYESGSTFYEDATQQAGDVPVYRLFDATHGTQFLTGSQTEYAGLTTLGSSSYRPDLTPEGVAFYAPAAAA